LDRLASSRPVAELEALLADARPVCRIVVTSGSRSTVCAPPVSLAAELGRAKRRAELDTALAKAAAGLAAAQPAKTANSDAKALARYLVAVGIGIGPDRLNDLLVLLAVLIVELGAGVSISVGMALGPSGHATSQPAAPVAASASPSNHSGQPTDTLPARSLAPVAVIRPTTLTTGRPVVRPATSDVLDWWAGQGGRATTSRRKLADHLGRRPTAIQDELLKLAATGRIRMACGPRGTVLEILPAG
jgi:hypothetical protein